LLATQSNPPFFFSEENLCLQKAFLFVSFFLRLGQKSVTRAAEKQFA